MGHKAVELLLKGDAGKALGIKENQVIDLDIDEALSSKGFFDKEMYDIAKILSI